MTWFTSSNPGPTPKWITAANKKGFGWALGGQEKAVAARGSTEGLPTLDFRTSGRQGNIVEHNRLRGRLCNWVERHCHVTHGFAHHCPSSVSSTDPAMVESYVSLLGHKKKHVKRV